MQTSTNYAPWGRSLEGGDSSYVAFILEDALGSISQGLIVPLPTLPFSAIPTLPTTFWIGAVLVVVGLVVYVATEKSLPDNYNFLIGCLIYLLFYGYLSLAQANLRYYDSWSHTAMTDFVVTNGHTNPDVFYNNWPGFHLWYAQLQILMGIDIYFLGRFSPVIINLIFFLFLYLFFKKAGNSKIALLGLIVFIIVNDRFYNTVQPTVLSLTLYMAALYLGFFELDDRRFWTLATILLGTSVFIHPVNVLWNVAAIATLIVILKIARNRAYSINHLLNQFVAITTIWVLWLVDITIVPLHPSMRYILNQITSSVTSVVAQGGIISYSPSYWYRGTPIDIIYIIVSVIAVVGILGVWGFSENRLD